MRSTKCYFAVTIVLFYVALLARSSFVHIKLHSSYVRHRSEQLQILETAKIIWWRSDWTGRGLNSWSQVERNLTSAVDNLNVSDNALGEIVFTQTFENLQTLACSNASISQIKLNGTFLKKLSASRNRLASFRDTVLVASIKELDLSENRLSDWENFKLPQHLQILLKRQPQCHYEHYWLQFFSRNQLTYRSCVNLTSLSLRFLQSDLSSNELTAVVGIIFPQNLTTLDLSNNNIHAFEIREADVAVLSNLAMLKMDDLEQSSCPTKGASTERIGNIQVCIVSETAFQSVYFPSRDGWKTEDNVLYLSAIVSVFISLWFVTLVLLHFVKNNRQQATTDKLQRDTVELSLPSRQWSQSKEEEFPNDIRFDPEFESCRIDSADIMQVRTLAHGNFAMTSLVHLGEKQAVMKKFSAHFQGRDRDQMIAFMDEIRVIAKLRHPNVVGFLGFTWSSILDLSVLVDFIPNGSLAAYLKEMATSQSTLTWMQSHAESPSKLSLSLQLSKALVYLQSFAPPVIHGHLKAASVLLDSALEVKLNRIGTERTLNRGQLRTRPGSHRRYWLAVNLMENQIFIRSE
ncbi:hypothetical protein CCR75_006797 [Bremia lactucae]|uniref:Protein kinase domain-containing protein n=1 Tax=Bremia lactucae TaxID=4779 RepID=A0A976IDB5_BRELC|nr:hypothetical protein CCR75_006797 [Bremia lactucae]